MKVVDADTFEEFDASELESRIVAWLKGNADEAVRAQVFLQATSRPPRGNTAMRRTFTGRWKSSTKPLRESTQKREEQVLKKSFGVEPEAVVTPRQRSQAKHEDNRDSFQRILDENS